jgi:hypothetical protein
MDGKSNNAADYPFDTLLDRDGAGPIFPVGTFDDELRSVQRVIGTLSTAIDGVTVALSLDDLRAATERGDTVTHRGVTAVPDGSGFRLVDGDGQDLQSSEASWFAWIQRFPDTDLWPS